MITLNLSYTVVRTQFRRASRVRRKVRRCSASRFRSATAASTATATTSSFCARSTSPSSKRLVVEHNRERPGRTEPLSASDILNCALDFALEHPGAFLNHRRASSVELRDTLAHEVYRRALVHFMLHEFI